MIIKVTLLIWFWSLGVQGQIQEILYPGNKDKVIDMLIEYQPIGLCHSDLAPQSGAPRQGALEPGNKGTIEIYKEYTEAMNSLENYQYIIVLYHMHLSGSWHAMVRPPGAERSFGLFATRSPNRPNPIGLGVIKLEKIVGSTLYVSGIDAFDGTPVLDIKPWIPSIDCPGVDFGTGIESDLGIEN